MDRCPYCRHPLYFTGIQLYKRWLRWLECHKCGRFLSHDESGTVAYFGMTPPHKGAFRTTSFEYKGA